ncbi:MAG TPA: acetylxylan esterase [Candidatus Hydrogenedentes bacterium]|nr:acetylxylan esterase [Candidatus Hydrogenedentota bacterium]
MFQFDLPFDQLQDFTLPQTKEPDFDAFWRRILDRSKAQPLDASAATIPYVTPEVRVEEVSFAAYDGGRIAGWSLSLRETKPRPTMIFWHGYGGHKGSIMDFLVWALQGITVLTFDVRGQLGDSTDLAEYPGGHTGGWISWGILEPEQYYLTRAYADTARALDYACTRADVDPSRIGTTGCSQGGGLSLAACSLDARPALCFAEVPGFCHFRRTLEMTRANPWPDLYLYLAAWPDRIDRAMRTLSYVELNNLADRITCPTLVSVGLVDELCLPSTIYAAYNRIPAKDKKIVPCPFRGHEAGLMRETMLAWARTHLVRSGG